MATMRRFTPKEIRDEFLIPMRDLVATLAEAIADMDAAIASGDIENGRLPLSYVEAKKSLGHLEKFKNQIMQKTSGSRTGIYWDRAPELEKAQEKYRKKRSQK